MSDREELLALRRMAELEAKASGSSVAVPPAPTSEPEQAEPSGAASLAANPLMRFAIAAGSPVMGAGEWLPGAAGKFFAENNQILKQLQEEGKQGQSPLMQGAGIAADIGGTILSPAFLKLGKAFQAAKTISELMATGAAIGAAGGAATPLGTDDLRKKMEATAGGSALGSVVNPVVVGATRMIGNMVAPIMSKAQAEKGAARVATKLGGDDADLAAATLATGGRDSPFETASQTLAPLVNPKFSALQKEWSNRLPEDYVRNLQIQEAAKKGAIKQLGIDTEVARSTPLNEANRLSQAIVGTERKAGAYADEAASAVDDLRRLERARSMAQGYDIAGAPTLGAGQRPVIGTGLTQASSLAKTADRGMDAAAEASLKAGAQARVAENLVGGWEARGLKPLTADSIIGNIQSIKTTPTNVTNDTLRLVLNKVENALKRAERPDGTIPAESIYTLRKTGINDLIERMSGENKDLAKRLSANELQEVKKYLDDAIEKAGGKGWSKYLEDYSAARTRIDSPLDRLDASKAMENAGMPEVIRVLNEGKVTGPGLVDRKVSIMNSILRAAEGVAGEHVNRAGAKLMLPENSQRLGLLMQQQKANPLGLLGDFTRNQGGLAGYESGLLFGNKE